MPGKLTAGLTRRRHRAAWQAFRIVWSAASVCTLAVVASPLIVFAQAPRPAAPEAGATEPGYLGVIADDRMEKGDGVRVLESLPNSPAKAGGLEADDLIKEIDGQHVPGLPEMAKLLQRAPAGRQVKFLVERAGELVELTVTLGERPAPDKRRFESFGPIPPEEGESPAPGAPSNRRRLLGLTTVALTPAMRSALAVPVEQGAVVSRVDSRSPAAEARIPVDAVIVAVNGQPIEGPNDLAKFINQLGPGKSLELSYFVRGQRETARVALKDYLAEQGLASDAPFGFGGGSGAGGGPPLRQPDDTGPLEARRLEALEARLQRLEAKLEALEARLSEKP